MLRRDFLKSAAAAAAAASTGVSAEVTSTQSTRPGELPRRTLGRTKESVTIVGLGCAYAGADVSEAQTRATIEAAIEEGVRYFDAAPEYTQAEVRLGPAIKAVRNKVFLVTKTYAPDAAQAEKDLAQALRQLGTDHVDLYLQHGVGLQPIAMNNQILGKGGSLEYLRKAKKAGLTRFIGLSAHAPYAPALQLLEQSDAWDVVMPFLNYVTHARETLLAENELDPVGDYDKLLKRACQNNIGIVGMKVLGGHPGPLATHYDRAFRYALSLPGVACVIIGVRSAAEVHRAARAAREFKLFSDAEMEETLKIGKQMVHQGSSTARSIERHIARDFGSGHYA